MSCDYCDERKGIKTVYNIIYGNRNRIVYETEHFLVFPCMGQLREGHLLIASKKHINALGNLGTEQREELEKIIFLINNFYKKEYNMNLLCFEHGVLGDSGYNGGCGIYHMHIHLLPTNDSEFSEVLNQVQCDGTNKICKAKGLKSTCDCIAEKRTYVLLGQINEEEKEMYIVTSSENYFESQYMRKVVCKILNKQVWDWKQVKNEEQEFLNTLEKSKLFLKTVKD